MSKDIKHIEDKAAAPTELAEIETLAGQPTSELYQGYSDEEFLARCKFVRDGCLNVLSTAIEKNKWKGTSAAEKIFQTMCDRIDKIQLAGTTGANSQTIKLVFANDNYTDDNA